MEYCCTRFKQRHELSSAQGLNIRVIEYKEDTPNLSGKIGFFLTTGYIKGEVSVMRSLIDFCPYCGMNLHDYYDRRAINEEDHSFMKW